MSTFDYLTTYAAVTAAQADAPGHRQIVGLRGISAGRLPFADRNRTAAGNMRNPSEPWAAHSHLEEFREIKAVEFARDADPGTAEVFYTDGTSDVVRREDLLCVERPVGKREG